MILSTYFSYFHIIQSVEDKQGNRGSDYSPKFEGKFCCVVATSF